MLDNNGNKVLVEVMKTQKIVQETNGKVNVLAARLIELTKTVANHDQVLYGDPKKMGEGGVIHTTQDQESRIGTVEGSMDKLKNDVDEKIDDKIKGLRNTLIIICTAIFGAIQASMAAVWHYFK